MKVHFEKTVKATASILLASTLFACGGGGGGDNPVTKTATGTLVVADNTAATATRILLKANGLNSKTADCPSVPNGYSPLQSVTVEFLDQSGAVISSTTTDDCGEFTANVPEEATQVKTSSPDNRDLIADIEVFGASGSGVASTISQNAEYQIASMQTTGDTLAYTITDTATNKAVIGIPESAFSVTVNAVAADISSIQSASNVADPASLTLVLDASGSMDTSVVDQNGDALLDANGAPYNRLRIAALASHTYLDNMPTTDESGFVVFDHDVNVINDETIQDLFALTDVNGATASYTFSQSGYSSTPSDFRFVVDSYNQFSSIHSIIALDEFHADTPELTALNYPWGGATAMYDAIDKALDETIARSNLRKLVIAMSDGEDNSSINTEATVITKAQDNGIPVYTIAYGDADPETMENIAMATNATSYVVDGADLTAAFQSIQTGITFQYIANLMNPLTTSDVVNLSMDYNGLQTSREITH